MSTITWIKPVQILVLMLGVCTSSVVLAGVNQWTKKGDPGRETTTLVIDPQTPTTLYAVLYSDDYSLSKSTDGGESWVALTLPNVGGMINLAIDPTNPTTIYASYRRRILLPDGFTTAPVVFRSIDGGVSWEDVTPSPGYPEYCEGILAVAPTTPAAVYVACSTIVFTSANEGAMWTSLNAPPNAIGGVNALAVDPTMPTTLYMATQGGIYKSVDGGVQWTILGPVPLLPSSPPDMIAAIYSLTIDPMTPSTMYASTAYGLFKSVDGGMNWLATGLPAGVPVLIDSRHPTTLYAAISNPVLQSTDGGKSWASINNGLPPSISALVIDPISGSTLYAAAYNYLLPNNPLGEGGVFEYQVVGPQEPNILASMESPEDGQPVSGIGVVRGWGFSTQADAQLSPLLPLIIDDVRGEDWFPCCSERGDVQAAFPQFPSSQTGKSGWGGVFNWGTLGSGPHTVQVPLDNVIYDPQGLGHLSARLFPALHTVTVIKPGDFEFLDRFDLSQASAGIAGNELVLTGVIVRDIFSQQQKKIDVHFRWFSNLQALGMVQSETTATLSSLCTVLSTLFASVSSHLRQGMGFVTNAHADSGITSYWESPEEGQAVSGIGILRGWAFSDDVLQMPLYESSIGSVQIIIDGEPYTTLPCCSPRADVSAVFPVPNAAKSGWALHFNYGILSPGPHTISVALTASHSPTTQTVSRIVQVVRVGGFPFLDQFDLAPASARIEGEDIVLSGVQVRDKASQQTKNIEVRARWFQNSQSLGIVASTE